MIRPAIRSSRMSVILNDSFHRVGYDVLTLGSVLELIDGHLTRSREISSRCHSMGSCGHYVCKHSVLPLPSSLQRSALRSKSTIKYMLRSRASHYGPYFIHSRSCETASFFRKASYGFHCNQGSFQFGCM